MSSRVFQWHKLSIQDPSVCFPISRPLSGIVWFWAHIACLLNDDDVIEGLYMGGIYVYNVLQCPMEFIHGRQSLVHNFLSAGTIGYIGVSRGMLGVPFVDYSFFYRYPQFSPATVGFAVYGGIASLLALLQGKQL